MGCASSHRRRPSDVNFNRASVFTQTELEGVVALCEEGVRSSTNEMDADLEIKEFECLSTTQIVALMMDTVEEVATIAQLNQSTTRRLFNCAKWDKDVFLDRFYGEDRLKFFMDAKAVAPINTATAAASSNSTSGRTSVIGEAINGRRRGSETEVDCSICFRLWEDDWQQNECGHKFCTHCWNLYLTGKITDDGFGSLIQCPGYMCFFLVEDNLVMKVIENPQEKLKYERNITNEFVSCHPRLRWCTAPGCTNAIKTSLQSHRSVRCDCGQYFCFSCGGEMHDPVMCHLLEVWQHMVAKDGGTANFIVNTRECPWCGAPIEKNGGSNHITCAAATATSGYVRCGYEFCWVCLGRWPHEFECCNIFAASDPKSTQGYEIDRFVHHSTRYHNHMESLLFEDKLHETVETTMTQLLDEGLLLLSEKDAIRKAVKILCCCRRTLAFSYVFAFFLEKKNNQCEIFEENQSNLEMATESLSECLEHDLNGVKIKVINQSDYCENRRRILMAHVKEGEDLGTWEMKSPSQESLFRANDLD